MLCRRDWILERHKHRKDSQCARKDGCSRISDDLDIQIRQNARGVAQGQSAWHRKVPNLLINHRHINPPQSTGDI